MKKQITIFVLTAVFTTGTALASGWRIPEQSVNSTALSAAYVANAHGADAAYFNPANMSFAEETEKWQLEVAAMYIHLASIAYTDNDDAANNGDSKKEHFLLPLFHLVSPEWHNMHFGLSFTVPGGLSKRWDDPYPVASAGEFSLEILELNPTLSYRVHERVAVAGGVRAVYSEGRVRSNSMISRELEGDSLDAGYNLALTVRPLDNLSTAITWRSKVDLNLEGDATLKYTLTDIYNYDGHAEVRVPLPEVLTVAVAYTLKDTTIELSWDRTFWSDYDELDFDYDQTYTSLPFSLFDNSVAKDYNDADAFRIGVTHKMMAARLTLMAGFALDETPVPARTLGFELPDSDARIYSLGGKYKINDQYELGLAYLYDDKEERKIRPDDENDLIVGDFKNAAAHIVTLGLNTTF
ncbi:MAG: outer membrane protein transport protein [Desulfurivibrionaceae bacterium]|nr:outer membrane protein transport protein [Desulfurivibrionaceae bacterium]